MLTAIKQNWVEYSRRVPGVMLDVVSMAQPLQFIPQPIRAAEKISRPSNHFAMTQPWNYRF